MNTAKEKAEELVLEYLRLQEPNYNWFHKGLAKQCALIAVEKILNVLFQDHKIDYWKKVKQELENL
jgi:nitrogenase molybdenum-iron protein alpha/beta subunit